MTTLLLVSIGITLFFVIAMFIFSKRREEMRKRHISNPSPMGELYKQKRADADKQNEEIRERNEKKQENS